MYGHETPEWGEVYDAAFGAFNEEAGYYVAEAERAGGPVLEVGCGTGRVLLPTAGRGVECWGVDLSKVLLERLARKAGQQGLRVTTVAADMRTFRLPHRFPVITVPNRAFLHMATTGDQIAALENFRHHLVPGGCLLLNFYHPGYRFIAADDVERREGPTLTLPDSGRILRMAESVRRDRVNQLNHVTFHFKEEAPKGGLAFDIRFTHRWIFKAEFGLLLRAAGFERWQVCGGFHGEPLERDDQEMVWTAWAG